MRRLSALALIAALGAAFVVSVVSAQPGVLPYWVDQNGAKKVIQPGASSALPTSEQDKDRDFPTFINLFSSVVLPGATIYQMNSPKYIGQFSRAVLMLSWGLVAAADSDSVSIVIRVYGRTSLNGGTRYLWTPQVGINGASDSCQCAGSTQVDTSAIGASKCLVPDPTFFVTRTPSRWDDVNGPLTYFGRGAGLRVNKLRKIPRWAWRDGASTNGIMLPLSDNAGSPCPFPYIEVEVLNLQPYRGLTSVTCDVWPRVN